MYLTQLPPIIARKKVDWFLGGVVSASTLRSADSKGVGPLVRQIIGESTVAYPTIYLLAWLEERGVNTIVVPRV